MKSIIDLYDFFNDYLSEVDIRMERMKTLLDILIEHYFTKIKIEENQVELYYFQHSYKQIQALVNTIFDIAFEANKIINEATNMNIRDIFRATEITEKNLQYQQND